MAKKYFNILPTLVTKQIFRCDYINAIDDKSCLLVRDAVIIVHNGKIVNLGAWSPKYEKESYLDMRGFLALPGFFDMHFHWVQDDVRLKPKASLLTWLSKYTWPYEAKFKSVQYSKKRAKAFSKELTEVGTFGGACYATVHDHTVDHALENFLGEFTVGHTLMTMNSPGYLQQTIEKSLNQVKRYSKKYKHQYCLTPRFAPTTHPELMKEGMKLAKKNKCFVQTHLSETKNEIEYVLGLYKKIPGFEDVKTYTEIYRRCGLLGKNTIMGHGIHLSPAELREMAKTKTAIAHCPTSNAPVRQKGLGSGLFDFKKAERYGVRWALGSDIGGGPYLSMVDVMRSFILQNKKADVKGATATKALFRATKAGAEILGVQKTQGGIEKGMLANMVFFKSPRYKKGEKASEVLEKIIMRGSRTCLQHQAMASVYKGQLVFSQI